MLLKRFLYSLLFFLFLAFFFSETVLAQSGQEKFQTDYVVTYNMSKTGISVVKFDVTLTNKTDEFYASSYKIDVGYGTITNVSARDGYGSIAPDISKKDDGNIVYLQFNERVVGLSNKLHFTVTFETPDAAKKQGNIWQIAIPGIAKENSFSSFVVHVNSPEFQDFKVFEQKSQALVPFHNLTFTKEDLERSDIRFTLGDVQYYNFQLTYHLQNPNLYPIKTEIALPPSTGYQDVFIDTISPLAQNVTVDEDGNWLATYRILPGKKTDVIVRGKAKVFATPQKHEDLSKEEKLLYTKQQKYWEVSDKQVQELAVRLKTPEAIYTYLVENLSYDYDKITGENERYGAKRTLNNPKNAVCLEFTDLFIALARAAGIPAREINGYAYTENEKQQPLSLEKDILHAWPEYYDEKLRVWKMVDPTWGNTTFGRDFFHAWDHNHFTFVVKGASSEYPIPAGGYKFEDNLDVRDVSVGFIDKLTVPSLELELSSSLPKSVIAGSSVTGQVTIKNNSSTSLQKSLLVIKSTKLTPKENVIRTKLIPPFGSYVYDIAFDRTPFLTNDTYDLTISFDNKTYTHAISIKPLYMNLWAGMGVLGSVLFAGSLFIYSRQARRLRVPRP